MLDLVFDLQRSDPTPAMLPATLVLEGVRTHLDLPVQGASTRIHRSLPLDPARESGYGSIELPPDANGRDNTTWFVYGPPPLLRRGAGRPGEWQPPLLANGGRAISPTIPS